MYEYKGFNQMNHYYVYAQQGEKLIEASTKNDKENVQKLLNIYCDKISPYNLGLSLQAACKNGFHDIVGMIVESSRDRISNEYFGLSLASAFNNNHMDIVYSLVKNAGDKISEDSWSLLKAYNKSSMVKYMEDLRLLRDYNRGKVIFNASELPDISNLPSGERTGGIILREIPLGEIVDPIDRENNLQLDSLAQAFKREKVPFRYLLPDRDMHHLQIFATDIGKIIEVNNKPTFISSDFQTSSRVGEEKTANLLFEGNLNIPVVRLQNGKNLYIESGDLRQMPGFNVWFLGGGINSGTGRYASSNYALKSSGEYNNKEMALRAIARDFASETGAIIIPINLKDRDYFHLDCCFLPLDKGKDGKPWAIIYEGTELNPTMDRESINIIKKLYGDDHLIKITSDEAKMFATNCVVMNNGKIFAPKNSFLPVTKQIINDLGYKLVEVDYSSIQKDKGSIRCTTLEIPESLVDRIMRPTDDIRLEKIKETLHLIGKGINYDKRANKFVLDKEEPSSNLGNNPSVRNSNKTIERMSDKNKILRGKGDIQLNI